MRRAAAFFGPAALSGSPGYQPYGGGPVGVPVGGPVGGPVGFAGAGWQRAAAGSAKVAARATKQFGAVDLNGALDTGEVVAGESSPSSGQGGGLLAKETARITT